MIKGTGSSISYTYLTHIYTHPYNIHACTLQIFGWLATFVWFASIWFVYKDTFWHKDRTGPLAKLYQPKEEGQGGGGGGGQDEGTQRECTLSKDIWDTES